jgi:response regulator NasT
MTFRIVIAEDEPLSRRDLAEMLGEMGHDVVGEARDGREALDLVAARDPDLVLLDVMMPGLDGIEVARRVGRDRPAVILTAHSGPDFVARAVEAGVMAYLGKPIREQDIGPAIQLAVGHFLARSELSARVERLTAQLQDRKLIERAKALLMTQEGIADGDAYRRMQQLSMERNLPLARVAEAVLAAFSASGPNSK